MEKLYRQFNMKTISAAIVFITLILSTASGQDILEGIVRIKVSETLASELEQKTFSTTSSGEVLTGVEALDMINRQFHVRRFKKIFPDAGKNEARHRRYGLHLWYEMNMDKGIPVMELIQSYRAQNHILKAEPVYKKAIVGSNRRDFGPKVIEKYAEKFLPSSANDPLLGTQWHYNNTGQTGGRPGADISLIDAWKIETGNKQVIIAVTDQGIQSSHVDLAANMWVNTGEIPANALDDDNNGYIDDVHGYSFINQTGNIPPGPHGTHVAGTIAAVTNNGIGVAGVAGGSGENDGVRLMSCAVFPDEGSGDGFAEAYVYSADNGAVISQNSWGYTFPGVYETVVLEAIDYFIAEAGKDENGVQTGPMNGGLMIFSAGNENDEGHYYPAYYEPVIAVASSTHTDKKAVYSNYGEWIDITAPGGETYQNTEEGIISTLPDNEYGAFMGTSMACPHVSGVAGLILSKFSKPGFRPETLRQRILHSVDDIYSLNPGYAGKLGTGRLNAERALLRNDATPPDAVTDLAVADKDVGEMTLTWTSPQDPGGGFVVEYDIRYSNTPITAANFNSATKVEGTPTPGPAGTKESFTISNLVGGRVYYFALKAIDFLGNVSPISNVVSATAVLTPSIAVTPTSVTVNLKTAEKATRTLTIKNTGQGPLNFSIAEPGGEDTFYAVTPVEGVITSGSQRNITITFDASGLFTGTYRHDLTIRSNDPRKNIVTIPLILQVTNNGTPIAYVEPVTIDFKSAQTGHSIHRNVTVFNEGSDALVISKITSNNTSFHGNLSAPLTIAPFDSAQLRLTFSPTTTGLKTGTISIYTNDPAHPVLKVTVRGEALGEAPLVITPDSFVETLERGTKISRTMVLRNNGSQEIAFRLDVANSRLAGGQDPASLRSAGGRLATMPDSTVKKAARMREEHLARLAAKYQGKENIIGAVGQPGTNLNRNNKNARTSRNASTEVRQYETSFEEFTPGRLTEQHGWFDTGAFSISEDNPDKGTKHLRGTSAMNGSGEEFALSPALFGEEYDLPRYSHTSMRINIDEAAGTTWQVVPQDIYYVATRIVFNPDRTIDAMVIDDEYEVHFKRVPVTTPEGYFDLAIEYNNWGSDTSGFPTYLLFINNQHVFSGTGIGFVLGQVAFVSSMEATGPTFDVDEFKLSGGEYIPDFVKPTPTEGVIPGGQSRNITVQFDASIMKFGNYESDLVVHIDETDSVVVPVSLSVTGAPSIRIDPTGIGMEIDKGEQGSTVLTLTNAGGDPVAFEIENDVPGLTIFPERGTLPLRENLVLNARFNGPPGFYIDTVYLHTDFQEAPLLIPVNIVVYDSGAVFVKPQQVRIDVPQGQISTRTFRIRNDGINTVSFIAQIAPPLEEQVTVDPVAGTIADEPFELTLTIDARNLSAQTWSTRVVYTINDRNATGGYTTVFINVVEDPVRFGSIDHEMWTGISGRDVGSIPTQSPPTRTTTLNLFEAPSNQGDNYGSRIRGYILTPEAGYYTFWIASNDNSALWLSSDEDPQNKVRIAAVNGYTNPRQWDKFASQRSEPVYLEAFGRYYIEALHKEGVGTDHVAVAWQVPGAYEPSVIEGKWLSRFQENTKQTPSVRITSPEDGATFSVNATIVMTAEAEDADGNIVKVEFYNGAKKLGIDTSAPYAFTWNNVQAGNYTLTARAIDNSGATDSASVNVTVSESQSCAEAGHIIREQWSNIPGTLISAIPVNSSPTLTETLQAFEARRNVGDNYGARIRGFLCVPQSGQYTFWIASNDKSELWLSTNDDPANKVRVAYVSGYTDYRQWSKYPSQKSILIPLEAGKKYYIEALHKEGVGTDHLSVGWQLPDKTMERPIPGTRLLPFSTSGNRPPVVVITNPVEGDSFTAPATVQISADAFDYDGAVTKVEFFNGTRKLGEDLTAPYTFSWRNVIAGDYSITAVGTDNSGASSASPPVHMRVAARCSASGTITREYWTGISGTLVSTIPVNTTPDGAKALTLFEGPVNAGTNYGARISGYICPPTTGDYYFWIASNDHSELWLSTDDQEQNKARIASVTGATNPRQWTKFPSQKSVAIRLTQGRSYYIEALHKQGIGSDHVSVGWQLPDGTLERPIGGNRLSPSASSPAAMFSQRDISDTKSDEGMDVRIYPNPVSGGKLTITVENPGMAESAPRQIEIRQVTGLSVYQQTDLCAGDCTTEIDVSQQLTSGVYILQVRMGGRVFTEKLVVR